MDGPVAAMLLLALALIPPLTDGQRERLALAHDDRDHQEEAFVALRESVERWPVAAAPDVPPPAPDVEVMLEQPGLFRGRLYRLEGVLQQRERLAAPHESVVAWFLRDDAGRPLLVYVCSLGPDDGFRPGRRLVLDGRFYKRVTMTARDGVERPYAAFVGAQPRAATAATAGVRHLWLIVFPVAIMIVVFVALLLYTRRHARRTPVRRGAGVATDEPPEPPLPPDSADALAELRRRAGARAKETS
ncbi:MAG: hypothetical protein ACYTGG_01340 [Planctomycetota bacterium]|jgi:hypothetical protein